MTAAVTQDKYEPGAIFTLQATLKEYNLPVEKRAALQAELEYPDHTRGILYLTEKQPGVFETTMAAGMPGIYRFTVSAKGVTYKGVPFTREQILNAAVFHDIHNIPGQPDGSDGGKNVLCGLLSCLLGGHNLTPVFEESLVKHGINPAGIRKCMELFCKNSK